MYTGCYSQETSWRSLDRIWQPVSWRDHLAWQQPAWDGPLLDQVTQQITSMPSLVSACEIEALRNHVAEAALGRQFILQGGDCAERFQDCNEQAIAGRIRILLQMSLVIGHACRKPVIPIGRMAGQYAKPRTDLIEILDDGLTVPAFRGENINGFSASPIGREPDPQRLLQAYHFSGSTLNFVRTLMSAGFADLRNLDEWQLSSIQNNFAWARYERIVSGLKDALAFLERMGGPKTQRPQWFQDFYVSHEALVLPYEEAMTRFVPAYGRWYNTSAHMVWIGDRTRQLDGAHVEYCRGIGNPVGVKLGPDANPNEVIQLVHHLNPHNEAGKITLITRMGASHVARALPNLIAAVQQSDLAVTWVVDPMHGNTTRTSDGRKTREFAQIALEVEKTVEVHRQSHSELGGVHLELTHDAVTECTGGSDQLTDQDLGRRYESWCDPRLNGSQSLEMAFLLAHLLKT